VFLEMLDLLSFSARVWVYPGEAAWHFVSLPQKEARLVTESQKTKERRGWGAVKVHVQIGKTSWETSIFPDKKSNTYLLPLKASVRKAEGVMSGDTIHVLVRECSERGVI
jgi:hypothetical protein